MRCHCSNVTCILFILGNTRASCHSLARTAVQGTSPMPPWHNMKELHIYKQRYFFPTNRGNQKHCKLAVKCKVWVVCKVPKMSRTVVYFDPLSGPFSTFFVDFQIFLMNFHLKMVINIWKNCVLCYSLKLVDMQMLVDFLRGYSILTSFQVRTASKGWSKYTTQDLIV